jgi:ATP-binding cassette subfamily B protein
LSYQTLYAELAYLSQEVPIFTGTIEQNVAFGLSEYTEASLQQALQRSACDFVDQAGMQGLQTKVGEVGKKLSGGQKQRIALSRIFIRDPSIIILDEATSALDNVTEAKVQNALDALSEETEHRTMIIVAHRLTTVQNADQIVVIDQGKVTDCGTHDELLTRSRIYQELNKTFAV